MSKHYGCSSGASPASEASHASRFSGELVALEPHITQAKYKCLRHAENKIDMLEINTLDMLSINTLDMLKINNYTCKQKQKNT